LSTTIIHGGTFRTEPHEYRSDAGVWTPSLTQTLHLAGLSNFDGADPDDLANAARRGDLLHGAVEVYNKDREGLDPCWITEEIQGYFEGYLKFERDTDFKPDPAWTELPMIVTIQGMPLGLKPDCFGRLGKWDAVVELKAAICVQPSWSVQTAMQEMGIFKSSHVGRVQRFALQLFKDGRYKLHPHLNHQEDEAIGIAALRTVHYRLSKGQRLWEKVNA
jgi:hypothetical protein